MSKEAINGIVEQILADGGAYSVRHYIEQELKRGKLDINHAQEIHS